MWSSPECVLSPTRSHPYPTWPAALSALITLFKWHHLHRAFWDPPPRLGKMFLSEPPNTGLPPHHHLSLSPPREPLDGRDDFPFTWHQKPAHGGHAVCGKWIHSSIANFLTSLCSKTEKQNWKLIELFRQKTWIQKFVLFGHFSSLHRSVNITQVKSLPVEEAASLHRVLAEHVQPPECGPLLCPHVIEWILLHEVPMISLNPEMRLRSSSFLKGEFRP